MKLKVLLIFTTMIFSLNTGLAQQESADTILKEAFAEAKKDNKNVMIIFKASWCGWCKRMIANVNNESVKDLFERNYVIRELDVLERADKKELENPGALELLKQYKADKSGIPFFLIYDAEGKLLTNGFDDEGQNLGCPASEEEVAIFIDKLKETSHLTEGEVVAIREVFVLKD